MTYYDAIAKGYDELHEEEQRRKLTIIVPKLSRTPHIGPVLDVGCGTGFSLDIVAEATGKECIGLEPSEGMRDQYRGTQTIIKGSAERIPFPDEHFAACISVTAIQNFSDIPAGIEEMRRVTIRGGIIVISCLKKSRKLAAVAASVAESLVVNEAIEEEKDIIFCCERKD